STVPQTPLHDPLLPANIRHGLSHTFPRAFPRTQGAISAYPPNTCFQDGQPCPHTPLLIGAISKQGVEVSYHGQGTAKAACMLIVSELGSDGKEHQLWQPVEVWGKKAEQVGELDPGAWVLVDGK